MPLIASILGPVLDFLKSILGPIALFFVAKRAGRKEAEAEGTSATLATLKAEEASSASSPSTQAELVEALKKGAL